MKLDLEVELISTVCHTPKGEGVVTHCEVFQVPLVGSADADGHGLQEYFRCTFSNSYWREFFGIAW